MNIISSKQAKNTVRLEQLVPQHDCLKLLILHTPYTLNISTLPLCRNLIKLDLSKNNLQSFPYLGHLRNLKFLFIHQNKLDILQLRGIFQQNGQKSHLSLNIVWATFWGNKNSFLGRHYLINETNVVAVDKNLVTSEEQSENFPFFEAIPPFHQSTDISYFFRKKMISRHASQEQYMDQLWLELKELRKKHQVMFPILKIQRWARGWLVRKQIQKAQQDQKLTTEMKNLYFGEWKKHISRQKKLRALLKERKKQYLLEKGKKGRIKCFQMKLVQYINDIRKSIIAKKTKFSNEIKIYKLLRKNFLTLKGLYQTLSLKASSAVYITRATWQNFEQHIIPIVHNKDQERVIAKSNKIHRLQFIFEPLNEISNQFIKIVSLNTKSLIFQASKGKTNLKKIKRWTQKLQLKKIYQPIHTSTRRLLQIKQHQDKLDQKQQYGLEQLIKVQGSYELLKDIIRATYFYNISNRLICSQNKVEVFSETMIIKIVSAVKIQKVWRGFSLRKRNSKYLKAVMRMQRAAIIIQRWKRRLPINHKKYFMLKAAKQVAKIQDKTLFIQMNDYFSLLKDPFSRTKPVFMEQDCSIYLNEVSQLICIGWNCTSTNLSVLSNIRMGKIMFSHSFFKKAIGLSQDQITLKAKYSKKMSLSDLSNLFHYQTASNIIKKQSKNYLSVTFASKQEARLRFLTLKLMTYSYKNNNGIKWLTLSEMGSFELHKTINIQGSQGCPFIFNKNKHLTKHFQERLTKDKISLYAISNKFYSNGEKNVIKMQNRFIICIKKTEQDLTQQVQKDQTFQENQSRRQRTQLSRNFINKSNSLLCQRQFQTQLRQDFPEHIKLRKIANKRSMKQFKVDKRFKIKKQNPNFILDSTNLNQRLATQPEYMPTHNSNLSSSTNNRYEKSVQRSKSRQLQERSFVSEIKQTKCSYLAKGEIQHRKTQDQHLVRRFANGGNFMQNLNSNDYRRRRIKTQTEHSAVKTAFNIKRSLQKTHSQRKQEIEQKLKMSKERRSQQTHEGNNHEWTSNQKSQKMKSQGREERSKIKNEKLKLKQLKVSLGQICYPTASRMKKKDYFS